MTCTQTKRLKYSLYNTISGQLPDQIIVFTCPAADILPAKPHGFHPSSWSYTKGIYLPGIDTNNSRHVVGAMGSSHTHMCTTSPTLILASLCL